MSKEQVKIEIDLFPRYLPTVEASCEGSDSDLDPGRDKESGEGIGMKASSDLSSTIARSG